MKKTVLISMTMILSVFSLFRTFGQCTPDTITCVDTLAPGEICPDTLPSGEVGVEYNQTVTIWPPSSFDYGQGTISIAKIK